MKLITNPYLVGGTAILWMLVSVGLSFRTADWGWFARSGAILTLSGGLLAARALLRLGVQGLYRAQHTIDGGHFIPTPEDIAKRNQQWLDAQSSHFGFWFIIIGTVIWAYGDLIGNLFRK